MKCVWYVCNACMEWMWRRYIKAEVEPQLDFTYVELDKEQTTENHGNRVKSENHGTTGEAKNENVVEPEKDPLQCEKTKTK